MSYKLDKLELLDYEQGEHLWPAITYASVTNYFLHKPCHDGEATKAYKSADAYQYVKSDLHAPKICTRFLFLLCKQNVCAGKVHNLRTAKPRPGLCILNGYVGPSQKSGPVYECWVLATEEGEIQDARCTCMAGMGRACSHAAAVCFVVDFWMQVSTTDPGPAPTEVPCEWIKPRLKKVAPNARVFTLSTCGPQANKPDSPAPVDTTPTQDTPDWLDVSLGAPLASFTATYLAKKGFQNENISELAELVMEKVRITDQESRAIEVATRDQAGSPLWFLHRKGRVTASLFKDVCRSKRVRCSTLINKIFTHRQLNVPAIKYGIDNEGVAKERLLAFLQGHHNNARIEPCGLMINPKYPLLGCSPDGVFQCDCHEPALVEIKCLYSLRDCNPQELLAEGERLKGFCLAATGGLKESHAYYYQVQAQLHLNIFNITRCYFYVHVDQGGRMLVIEKDDDFMLDNSSNVQMFLRDIVMPRIILGNTV
ncbi:hypothetical protein HPB48_018508 [Haemaphysalis longicornis]|uniref:SWIM-type domain-containing protein n=1 Tax=Haemaphysalis longicornis TaxID=44386 RepID=A0A9J6GLX3_HAELO|nr:hypothetical protein HPB48_018508 [Haemaphysalis longicornis]